jgi:hypothetical protein
MTSSTSLPLCFPNGTMAVALDPRVAGVAHAVNVLFGSGPRCYQRQGLSRLPSSCLSSASLHLFGT